MLSNAYLFAKFRFDTAENEPAKNSQIKNANSSAQARELAAVGWRPLTLTLRRFPLPEDSRRLAEACRSAEDAADQARAHAIMFILTPS